MTALRRLQQEILFAFLLIPLNCAYSAELRIVDTHGLVRGVALVKEGGDVSVEVAPQVLTNGECIVTTVDGVSTEHRRKIDSSHKCTFQSLPAGTWQLKVSGETSEGKPVTWRVNIQADNK